jgi:transcriptional regulator with XRE-family HTH domain|nr:MAG TPA: helix-turn-helix domain protein [Caudoviricetes sp.]
MSNEELKKNIGNRIKQLRIEANLTQEELANKLKSVKGKSSIANYENGSNLPSDEVKFQLCNIFNCSLDYLMCKTDIRNSEEQIKQEFEFAYHKEMEGLSDEEIADALRFYKQIKYGNKENKSDN